MSAPSVDSLESEDRSLRYQLRFLGDPILREKCVPIAATDLSARGELPNVISALKRQMSRESGLGMSANQVGSTLRVFIAHLGKGEIEVFVNPQYFGEKGPIKTCPGEGCLSIPGFHTSTKRHESVNLRWTDPQFGPVQARTFSGLRAQIIQQEMDHMEGVLLVDLPGVTRQQRRDAERLTARSIAKRGRAQ